MNTPELENTLRCAPAPRPPAGLKEQLIEQVRVPGAAHSTYRPATGTGPVQWLRRWWPVLVPGAASLACAVVIGLQQAEIDELEKTVTLLTEATAGSGGTGADADPDSTPGTQAAQAPEDELARLRALLQQLAAEIEQLRQLGRENEAMRAELASLTQAFSPEETAALEAIRQKAMMIECVNNLKQMGLAAIIWANKHEDTFPADLASLNIHLSKPRTLWCPADTARAPAADWPSFTPAHSSYEYLAPQSAAYAEPNRVVFRCPVHGSIAIADGSAHMGVAKTSPELIAEQDGKLYFRPVNTGKAAPAPASTGN